MVKLFTLIPKQPIEFEHIVVVFLSESGFAGL